MHEFEVFFLTLLLAHLLSDFVLQGRQMEEGKRSLRVVPYLAHGAIYYACALLCLLLFTGVSRIGRVPGLVVALLAVGHLIVDCSSNLVTQRGWVAESGPVRLAEQALQFVIVGCAAGLLVAPGEAGASGRRLLQVLPTLLPLVVAYVAVLFPGGRLIGHLLRRWEEAVRGCDGQSPSLPEAGKYIGWLERFLILTAILASAPTAVGLIVAAKSIFRFPEIDGRPLAEYFLVGTLLSVAVAVLGGIACRLFLLG